ncbi:MAG TPA: hypothetical protein VK302_23105 [Terriglobales bacterium]|nr:hypothetical protein [Terriglobales bacterium]
MRTAVALILFSIAAFAQDPAAVSAAQAACGPSNVKFDVKDDNSQHTVGQPEAGKALVYVIQEIGSINCIGGCITTKIALDGAWVGANHHNSYFSFAVDPGERHLCANWQSHFARLSQVVGLAHFTAEAGKVYFFRTRAIGYGGPTFFDIEPIDSDQGRLFVASIPLSISHPKK